MLPARFFINPSYNCKSFDAADLLPRCLRDEDCSRIIMTDMRPNDHLKADETDQL